MLGRQRAIVHHAACLQGEQAARSGTALQHNIARSVEFERAGAGDFAIVTHAHARLGGDLAERQRQAEQAAGYDQQADGRMPE